MKKIIQKKIEPLFTNPRLNLWMQQAQERLKPAIAYWVRLSPREQQLISLGAIVFGIFILVSIIGSAMDMETNSRETYIQNEQYRLNATSMAKEYKALTQITSNEFSQVTTEKVKGDVTQALSIKDPDVIIADNIMTINVANAKFEKVVLLLEQLRKSYGLFPSKLKITRLSQSGFVAFSATFMAEQ